MERFKISKFRIGDTVMRTKGTHFGGMKVGDIGKIIDMRLQGDRVLMIKLDRYPDWHNEYNFKKTTERNFKPKNKVEKYQHELELAKKKVEELESKLNKVNKNQMTKLDVDYRKLPDREFGYDKVEFFHQSRKIICYIKLKGKIVGKGVAIAMPEDDFKIETGCKLAFYRANANVCRKAECRVIKDTF